MSHAPASQRTGREPDQAASGRPATRRSQRGASATEFALIGLIFVTMTIAVMEFGRLMLIYTSAAEATRLGARLGAVCGPNAVATIKGKMRNMSPALPAEAFQLNVPTSATCAASPASCNVTAWIGTVPGGTPSNYGPGDTDRATVSLFIPFIPQSFAPPVPRFATTLPGEALKNQGPVCS
ncbi:MAG: pilus assembly protein [Burkholderiales bacterium]|nr:MAG: pilus assembly protein [Burkholderiales bacterium]